jgi:hypothetical protein
MIWKEVEEKYGKKMADKMKKSEFLNGITVRRLPNGEVDIPESDIRNAYNDVTGRGVRWWEWD